MNLELLKTVLTLRNELSEIKKVFVKFLKSEKTGLAKLFVTTLRKYLKDLMSLDEQLVQLHTEASTKEDGKFKDRLEIIKQQCKDLKKSIAEGISGEMAGNLFAAPVYYARLLILVREGKLDDIVLETQYEDPENIDLRSPELRTTPVIQKFLMVWKELADFQKKFSSPSPGLQYIVLIRRAIARNTQFQEAQYMLRELMEKGLKSISNSKETNADLASTSSSEIEEAFNGDDDNLDISSNLPSDTKKSADIAGIADGIPITDVQPLKVTVATTDPDLTLSVRGRSTRHSLKVTFATTDPDPELSVRDGSRHSPIFSIAEGCEDLRDKASTVADTHTTADTHSLRSSFRSLPSQTTSNSRLPRLSLGSSDGIEVEDDLVEDDLTPKAAGYLSNPFARSQAERSLSISSLSSVFDTENVEVQDELTPKAGGFASILSSIGLPMRSSRSYSMSSQLSAVWDGITDNLSPQTKTDPENSFDMEDAADWEEEQDEETPKAELSVSEGSSSVASISSVTFEANAKLTCSSPSSSTFSSSPFSNSTTVRAELNEESFWDDQLEREIEEYAGMSGSVKLLAQRRARPELNDSEFWSGTRITDDEDSVEQVSGKTPTLRRSITALRMHIKGESAGTSSQKDCKIETEADNVVDSNTDVSTSMPQRLGKQPVHFHFSSSIQKRSMLKSDVGSAPSSPKGKIQDRVASFAGRLPTHKIPPHLLKLLHAFSIGRQPKLTTNNSTTLNSVATASVPLESIISTASPTKS